MPRSQRITFMLPSLRMYSALMIKSLIVALKPRLSRTGSLLRPTSLQREVLHVAGADLKTIRVFFDHGKVARVHDFCDYRQACFRAGLSEKPKPIFTQSLKTVGGRARLERAAAQNFRARFFYDPRNRENLLFALDRAWAGNENYIFFSAHWDGTNQ